MEDRHDRRRMVVRDTLEEGQESLGGEEVACDGDEETSVPGGRREGVMLKLMPLCHDCALTSSWQATRLSLELVFA